MTSWWSCSDGEWLLLVLALLYASECSCWLRAGAVCLTSHQLNYRQHRWAFSNRLLENTHGRLVFTHVWPFSTSCVCQTWPIPLDSRGLVLGTTTPWKGDDRDAASADWMAWENVRCIQQQGPRILINDQAMAVLAEAVPAEFVAARLRTICQTSRDQRKLALGALLDELWDTRAITKRRSLLLQTTVSLRYSCTALFILTFAGGPLVLYASRFGSPGMIWGYLTAFLMIWLLIVIQYDRTRRVLYAESTMTRIGRTLLLALSPAAAMRAAENLTRYFLFAYDPLAVASVLCSTAQLAPLAERTLRDWHNWNQSDSSSNVSPSEQTECWFRDQMRRRAEQRLGEAGLEVSALVGEPLRTMDAMSYCPRCLQQYALRHGKCAECKSIPLQSFQRAVDVCHGSEVSE